MHGRSWLGVGAALAVAGAAAGIVAWPDPEPPFVDGRLRADLVPLIQAHLETKADLGGALDAQPELKSRWLCDLELIETERRGPDLLAGVYASCGEFAKTGASLVTGTGFLSPMRVTVRSGAVTSVERPLDGAGFQPTVSRMFTEAGERKVFDLIDSGGPFERDRLPERARRAFGLPADAPIRDHP
ncbi:hypothetical protein [Actinomadura rudentiformis]|uniref:Uncharacterized protein n=1 Tax=Actinomadura rudentiformis TaxID=359158 RepID=A0A6H9YUV1_9ACTN|nr:hypothetical protein [Actinomadura rudentiformis]KAB2344380.1 hypothetical protein F8566_31085 [Actinomadura rudentiformis]